MMSVRCLSGRSASVSGRSPAECSAQQPSHGLPHRSQQPRPAPRSAALQQQQRVRQEGQPRPRLGTQRILCSSAGGVSDQDYSQGQAGAFPAGMAVPTRAMAPRLGSTGGGGATLQRSKLDLKQVVRDLSPQLDNAGGAGGAGKGIFNGGGGDEGDDKDDYFSNFGDGDDDLGKTGLLRKPLEELYDPAAIAAVLQEWFRTIEAIPSMIRQSVNMGFFSSAQLVRFLSMDQRPSIARAVTRTLPPQVSRGAVGRMMADPAFAQKFVIEVTIAAVANLAAEAQQRGERFWRELDLVALNTFTLAAVQGALVWQVSPNRAHGMGHKHHWQNVLANLPNNVFDASTPRHRYSMRTRLAGAAARTTELCALGFLAGGAMTGLGQTAVALRRHLTGDASWEPSVPVVGWWRNTAGLGAYMGVSANARYQLVSGIDRCLFDRLTVLPIYLGFSTLLRALSTMAGQPTRLHFQGLTPEALQEARAAASPAGGARKRRVKVVKRRRKAGLPAAAAAGAAAGAAAPHTSHEGYEGAPPSAGGHGHPENLALA